MYKRQGLVDQGFRGRNFFRRSRCCGGSRSGGRFTKSLAQEFAPRKVTCNAIAPGFISTEMSNAIPANLKEEIVKKIPLKEQGSVEDIAALTAFLASDDARYILSLIHISVTPAEELLALPLLHPEQIKDTLHAYQMAKRCNVKRVMAEAVKSVSYTHLDVYKRQGMSHAYGAPADKKEMTELLARAVDMGYTFFDTADAYGTHG